MGSGVSPEAQLSTLATACTVAIGRRGAILCSVGDIMKRKRHDMLSASRKVRNDLLSAQRAHETNADEAVDGTRRGLAAKMLGALGLAGLAALTIGERTALAASGSS